MSSQWTSERQDRFNRSFAQYTTEATCILDEITTFFKHTPDFFPLCIYGLITAITIFMCYILNDMFIGLIPIYLTISLGVYTMILYWLLSTINPSLISNKMTSISKLTSNMNYVDDNNNTMSQPTSQTELLSLTSTIPLSSSTTTSTQFNPNQHNNQQSSSVQNFQYQTTSPTNSIDFNSLLISQQSSYTTFSPQNQTQSSLLPINLQYQSQQQQNKPIQTTILPNQQQQHQQQQQQQQHFQPITNTTTNTATMTTTFQPNHYQQFSTPMKTHFKPVQQFHTPQQFNPTININPNNNQQQYNQLPTHNQQQPIQQQQQLLQLNSNNMNSTTHPLPPPPILPQTTSTTSTTTLPPFNPQLQQLPQQQQSQYPSQQPSQQQSFTPATTFTQTIPQPQQSQQQFIYQPQQTNTISTHTQQLQPSLSSLSLTTSQSTQQQPISSTITTTTSSLIEHSNNNSILALYCSSTCSICLKQQPPRSYHCKYCRNCYSLRNHHCFILNTCITKKNMALYLHLLLLLLFETFLLLTISLYYFIWYKSPINVPIPTLQHNIFVFTFFLMLNLSLLYSIPLLLSQIVLTLSINLTWFERQLIRRWASSSSSSLSSSILSSSSSSSSILSLSSSSSSTLSSPGSNLHIESPITPNSSQQQQNHLNSIHPETLSPTTINAAVGNNNNNNNNNDQNNNNVNHSYITSTSTLTNLSSYNNNTKHRLEYQRHGYGSLKAFFDIDITILQHQTISTIIFTTLFPSLSSSSSSSLEHNGEKQLTSPTHFSDDSKTKITPSTLLSSSTTSNITPTNNNTTIDSTWSQLSTIEQNQIQDCIIFPNFTNSHHTKPQLRHTQPYLVQLVHHWQSLFEFHFKWCFPLLIKILVAPISILFHRAMVLTDDFLSLGDDLI